jgi:hypothetical protein
MKLLFIEQGKVLGDVRLVDGQLVGRAALKSIIMHRMQRNNCGVVEALKSLHGWSNGYLTTRLDDTIVEDQ